MNNFEWMNYSWEFKTLVLSELNFLVFYSWLEPIQIGLMMLHALIGNSTNQYSTACDVINPTQADLNLPQSKMLSVYIPDLNIIYIRII